MYYIFYLYFLPVFFILVTLIRWNNIFVKTIAIVLLCIASLWFVFVGLLVLSDSDIKSYNAFEDSNKRIVTVYAGSNNSLYIYYEREILFDLFTYSKILHSQSANKQYKGAEWVNENTIKINDEYFKVWN